MTAPPRARPPGSGPAAAAAAATSDDDDEVSPFIFDLSITIHAVISDRIKAYFI